MKNVVKEITYLEYDSLNELSEQERDLVNKTESNLINSYSPYSLFKVSALIYFEDGTYVLGTNQENAAYPSGLCAERVAVYSAKSNYPEKTIKLITIVTELGNEFPFSPCGSCRQSLMEYEMTQKSPIQVILKSGNSKIWKFSSISDLLPFAFEAEEILKKE